MDFLFVEIILVTDSILVHVIDLSYFLFLPGSVLGDCTFLRIYPFLPSCPIYWPVVDFYDPLLVCQL